MKLIRQTYDVTPKGSSSTLTLLELTEAGEKLLNVPSARRLLAQAGKSEVARRGDEKGGQVDGVKR